MDSERTDDELCKHANTSIGPSAIAVFRQAINIVKIKTNFFISYEFKISANVCNTDEVYEKIVLRFFKVIINHRDRISLHLSTMNKLSSSVANIVFSFRNLSFTLWY